MMHTTFAYVEFIRSWICLDGQSRSYYSSSPTLPATFV